MVAKLFFPVGQVYWDDMGESWEGGGHQLDTDDSLLDGITKQPRTC